MMLAIGFSLVLLAFTPIGSLLQILLCLSGIGLIFFTLWFFRDPERMVNPAAQKDPSFVVSPADGQITEITDIGIHPDLNVPSVQISIFLSPLNLHVNRYPATGVIKSVRYFPGLYLMAFHPKASTDNERSEFVLSTPHGPIVFRQITGFLARRIVYQVEQGAYVSAGERFGMMKFGSRMDVVVPAASEIQVSVGQHVRSASTILAQLPPKERL